jgi:hypothetical protein
MPYAAPPLSSIVEAVPAVVTKLRFWTSSNFVSTLQQCFPCGPRLARHLTRLHPSLFLPRSRSWLLAKAAEGVWNLLLQAGSEGPTLIS